MPFGRAAEVNLSIFWRTATGRATRAMLLATETLLFGTDGWGGTPDDPVRNSLITAIDNDFSARTI